MKCKAHIIKEFKSTKHDSMWPMTQYGVNDVGSLPVCGGNVIVSVRAVNEPDWGGMLARLEIKSTCSKCKWPYFDGRIGLEHEVELDITQLFEKGDDDTN